MAKSLMLWLLSVVVFSAPMAALRDFIAVKNFSVPSYSNAIAAADLNSDGNLDLLVVSEGESVVNVFFGDGQRNFVSAGSYPVGAYPQAVAVGDFNGDGFPDVVVGAGGADAIGVLINRKDGSFYPVQGYTTSCGGASSIAVGDFNRDAKLDLMVATAYCGVAFLAGNGDGTFGSSMEFAGGPCPSTIAAGDFNNDGNMDVVVGNEDNYFCQQQSDEIDVLLGNGDGTFRQPVSYPAGHSPDGVIVGDFNKDGKLDIAEANGSPLLKSGGVDVFLGRGDGSFQLRFTHAVDALALFLVASDFNGDGNLDLAVTCDYGNDVSILFGDGKGDFASAENYVTDAAPIGVVACNFGGGKTSDLAVVNSQGANVSLLVSSPDGTFQGARAYFAGARPDAIAMGDFNNDGFSDVVTSQYLSNYFNDSKVFVYLGDGKGDLTKIVSTDVTGGHNRNNFQQEVGIAVADFNRDGKLDVALNAPSGFRKVIILFGRGDGSFEAGPRYDIGNQSFSPAIITADFNDDGIADIASTNCAGNCISVMIGHGDGYFDAPVNYPTGGGQFTSVTAITSRDFNNDGTPDLVVVNHSNAGASTISILLGNGDGTFRNPLTYQDNRGPTTLAAGDLNGDGNQDFVVAYPENGAQIYLGKGDGTFQLGQFFAPLGWTHSLAVADFNHDGKLDIAIGNNTDGQLNPNSLSIFYGKGDGTVGAVDRYFEGLGPNLAVGNLVTTGGPDVVSVDSAHVITYLNKKLK